ncbi:ciliary rootlet coiled-coil protein 2-like [Antechinus flavipes]|uniref:ciliary rootlet coiled-coil protein 2-like n=1 Tax=Antechinus flavipes TaxID=38775 RepID=UPI00223648B2|nr:ciliary rootlet coiled-coil protein 2-like [Antechinus flavipes]
MTTSPRAKGLEQAEWGGEVGSGAGALSWSPKANICVLFLPPRCPCVARELRLQLESSQATVTMLQKQLAEHQREAQAAQLQLQEQRQEREKLLVKLEDQRRDLERRKASEEMLGREKEALQTRMQDLTQRADLSSLEIERLKATNTELQRHQGLLEQQEEEMLRKEERSQKELEAGQRSLKQLEEKISGLKQELVTVKESLNQAVLEKEVLESQKEGLRCSLAQVEASSAQLESQITKMRTEDTERRDSLVKMAALTESLAQDKVSLNRVILQLEQEKNQWLDRQWQLEQEVSRLRDQLAHLSQELDHIQREKQGLDQSLQMAEEERGNLEEEMTLLQREKVQLHERLMQVSCQKHTLEGQLDHSQQEIKMHADTLQQTILEKEEISKEKIRLVAEHTSLERQNRVLVEDRAAFSPITGHVSVPQPPQGLLPRLPPLFSPACSQMASSLTFSLLITFPVPSVSLLSPRSCQTDTCKGSSDPVPSPPRSLRVSPLTPTPKRTP